MTPRCTQMMTIRKKTKTLFKPGESHEEMFPHSSSWKIHTQRLPFLRNLPPSLWSHSSTSPFPYCHSFHFRESPSSCSRGAPEQSRIFTLEWVNMERESKNVRWETSWFKHRCAKGCGGTSRPACDQPWPRRCGSGPINDTVSIVIPDKRMRSDSIENPGLCFQR